MKRLVLIISCLLMTAYVGAQQSVELWMQSRMDGELALSPGDTTEFWGFGLYTPPIIPKDIDFVGSVLRFVEGDTVSVHFLNNSPEDHTIHWHGLDVDQANDGVPTTSSVVDPDSNRVYTFVATHAGTFNYHCHVFTTFHLSMGMYGLVVVDPDTLRNTIYTGGPRYTKDYNWLASELNRNWNDNTTSPGLFTLYKATHGMLNGAYGAQLQDGTHDVTGTIDDTIAMRLSSMGYGKVRFIFPPEAEAEMHMSDGRQIPNVIVSDTIDVYSGERCTVLLKPSVGFSSNVQVIYTDVRSDEVITTNEVPIHISGLGLEEQAIEQSIRILGNPVHEQLRVFVENEKITQLSVYSMDGKLLGTKDVEYGVNTFNLPLSVGTYLITSPQMNGAVRFVSY